MNTEQLSPAKKTIVGVQFLFVAFGATVLVPLLIGINPATALFTAGVGTLIFHVVTNLLKNAVEAGATAISISAYTTPDDSIFIDIKIGRASCRERV